MLLFLISKNFVNGFEICKIILSSSIISGFISLTMLLLVIYFLFFIKSNSLSYVCYAS